MLRIIPSLIFLLTMSVSLFAQDTAQDSKPDFDRLAQDIIAAEKRAAATGSIADRADAVANLAIGGAAFIKASTGRIDALLGEVDKATKAVEDGAKTPAANEFYTIKIEAVKKLHGIGLLKNAANKEEHLKNIAAELNEVNKEIIAVKNAIAAKTKETKDAKDKILEAIGAEKQESLDGVLESLKKDAPTFAEYVKDLRNNKTAPDEPYYKKLRELAQRHFVHLRISQAEFDEYKTDLLDMLMLERDKLVAERQRIQGDDLDGTEKDPSRLEKALTFLHAYYSGLTNEFFDEAPAETLSFYEVAVNNATTSEERMQAQSKVAELSLRGGR